MKPGDKELAFWLAVIAVVLWILWHWLHRRAAVLGGTYPSQELPGLGASDPWSLPVPGFPPPIGFNWSPSYNFGGVNVNEYPYSSGINSYFPMFGFVGIDSSQIYQ
jgi:hypothetical protein